MVHNSFKIQVNPPTHAEEFMNKKYVSVYIT